MLREDPVGSKPARKPEGTEIAEIVIVSVPVFEAVIVREAIEPTRTWPNDRVPLKFRILVVVGVPGPVGPPPDGLHEPSMRSATAKPIVRVLLRRIID